MSARRLTVLPPLSPSAHLRSRRRFLPFPLEEPSCRLHAWGRQALWHGLRSLPLEPGDEVLAPAYHHGSEIEALLQAGLRCRFYEITDSLEPDPGQLESLLSDRVRALFLIHYLGFPQAGERWREWCDQRGLLLIEDAAQAWLATGSERALGSEADLAIFCLYKSFGLPDGGASISRAPAPAQRRPLPGAARLLRRHLAWVAQRLATPSVRRREKQPYSPECDFALGDPDGAPSRSTARLLPRMADVGAAEARRANYAFLSAELGDAIAPGFERPPPGASPFAFPLRSDHKEAMIERLSEHGVMALDLWSEPHPSVSAHEFPLSARRRRTTVGLPVHQELSRRDVRQIADAAGEVSAQLS